MPIGLHVCFPIPRSNSRLKHSNYQIRDYGQWSVTFQDPGSWLTDHDTKRSECSSLAIEGHIKHIQTKPDVSGVGRQIKTYLNVGVVCHGIVWSSSR